MPFRLILAMILMLGQPLQAQGLNLFSMESIEDGRRWEAVGRLEIAGRAFCTGALIAPDLVLTAAHCLYDAATGKRVPIDEIQFLAGWRNGRAAAYRYIRKAVHLPDYSYSGQPGPDRVRNDIALLKLQLPIRNTTVKPFETAARPQAGDQVGVVSYAHDRSEAPSLQEMCAVIALQEGMLVLSCEVDFGASGSPVFSFADGEPRIISVVSSKAEAQGHKVSLGTALQEPLRQLMVLIGQDRIFRTVEQASSRETTGAKVVRP